MKKHYLMLVAAAALTLSFSSCKKDDDKTPAKTKTELLTASSWKVTAFTVSPAIDIDGDGTPDSDLLAHTDACSKDDITNFKADKTYTQEEGATKCDPNDPQIWETGSWAFSSDESTVTLTPTGGGTAQTYTVAELSATTLKATQVETDPQSGKAYTFTTTFSH